MEPVVQEMLVEGWKVPQGAGRVLLEPTSSREDLW